jgi:hypothetical protein
MKWGCNQLAAGLGDPIHDHRQWKAAGPDLRDEGQVAVAQFSVQRASVDTSLTNTRLPEMTGGAHVALSATV